MLSESFYLDCLIVLVTTLIGIVTFYKWSFTYWQKLNVPYVQPSIPFGSLKSPFGKALSLPDQLLGFYKQFKEEGHKYFGLFSLTKPLLVLTDIELIKTILTKDFDFFTDRGMYVNEKDDPLSAHLFSITGAKWRNIRVKITPTFTTGKMKMMYPIMAQCANQLNDLMNELSKGKAPVDIKDVLSRFTTDIIGSCAFGIDCNSCKDPSSEFRKNGKRLFTPTKMEAMKGLIMFNMPSVARFFRFCMTPRQCAEFFMGVVTNTVNYRENNSVTRKDFMQLMVDLKNSENGITIEELAAQAFVFFLAGYETSSATMSFALYELSQNQELQQRARDEVNTVLENRKEMSYEAIQDMKYLGQVVDETLRKYPSLPTLNRICVKDYKLPDFVIKKNMPILIPILSIQKDEEYFPNPEEFNPDRFSEENKGNIRPFTYLPFGDGPRVCIGVRFGVMQTKLGLATLLKNYQFTLNPKTDVPMEYNPFLFTLASRRDILLDVQKL